MPDRTATESSSPESPVATSPVSDEIEQVRHGIDGGFYDNLGAIAFGHLCPCLDCLCGWGSASGAARSWEEAGGLLDEHLASMSDQDGQR